MIPPLLRLSLYQPLSLCLSLLESRRVVPESQDGQQKLQIEISGGNTSAIHNPSSLHVESQSSHRSKSVKRLRRFNLRLQSIQSRIGQATSELSSLSRTRLLQSVTESTLSLSLSGPYHFLINPLPPILSLYSLLSTTDCQLPFYNCGQFGECNEYDGSCSCPSGYGGQDCVSCNLNLLPSNVHFSYSVLPLPSNFHLVYHLNQLSPLCGSPLDGAKRFPRENDDDQCCSPGYHGQTCNVCSSDASCSDVLIGGDRLGENGTCYTGGLPVKKSFQQCDVTNKKITDMLPGRPPTVAFDCNAEVSEQTG